MFAKALCANIGRNFPCVRNDVIYSFWKKNNGEYNFPMNCVWENNMKLNSLVAAHIIFFVQLLWLRGLSRRGGSRGTVELECVL